MAKLEQSSRVPRLKKRFGQNHLVDGRLCGPLLEFLRPRGARVLEIGPGGGVLTAELLAAGARLWACEVDLQWTFHLHRRFSSAGPSLLAMDAAHFPWERLPKGALVTGNLPFNVGTRLIENLLSRAPQMARAAFMVQKEVGERLVAGPGDPAYGSLSVIVAARARASYLGTLKPGSFRPAPKVSAAYVGLEPRPAPLAEEAMPAFVHLARLCFARRRKTLRNSLASQLDRDLAAAALEASGLDARTRAESLDLAALLDLFRSLEALRPGALRSRPWIDPGKRG